MNDPLCGTVDGASVSLRPTAWTIDDLPLLRAGDHLAVFTKLSGLLVHRGWGKDRVAALQTAGDLLLCLGHNGPRRRMPDDSV